MATIFLAGGLGFSVASLLDCKLVQTDAATVHEGLLKEHQPDDYVADASGVTGVGFYFIEDYRTGTCPLTNYYSWSYHEALDEFFGTEWMIWRWTAVGTTVVVFLLWVWMFTYMCVAHSWRNRALMAVCLSIFTTFSQGLSLSVLFSEYCQEHGCTIARTFFYSGGAVCCYILSSLFLLCGTYNYYPYVENERDLDLDLDDIVYDDENGDSVMRTSPRAAPRKKLKARQREERKEAAPKTYRKTNREIS